MRDSVPMQEHPMYPGYLNWKELSHDMERLRWPDQLGQRGRPRAIKFGYVKLALGYGIHARATLDSKMWNKFGSPWIPVYRAPAYQTCHNIKNRFMNKQFPEVVPEIGRWEFKVDRAPVVSDRIENWWYLYIRYLPPEDLNQTNGFSLVWLHGPDWLNGILEAWRERLEKENVKPDGKSDGKSDGKYGIPILDAQTPEELQAAWAAEMEADDDEPIDPEIMKAIWGDTP